MTYDVTVFNAFVLAVIQLIVNTWGYEFYQRILRYIVRKQTKIKNKPSTYKMVSIIIPIPGEASLSNDLQKYYFCGLKRLLLKYLPNQIYRNYEAIVYCDGPNKRIEDWVNSLNDQRVKFYSLEKQTGLFGHPQTRKGIMIANGDFFVRINCDNHPYPEYLALLVSGFNNDTGIVYGRVIFKGKARRYHRKIFFDNFNDISNEIKAFIIPRDKQGSLKCTNIDCMNYMVRIDLAKKYAQAYSDDFAADWDFINRLLKEGAKVKFIDAIIGDKL